MMAQRALCLTTSECGFAEPAARSTIPSSGERTNRVRRFRTTQLNAMALAMAGEMDYSKGLRSGGSRYGVF
jgi:hypothetical protein